MNINCAKVYATLVAQVRSPYSIERRMRKVIEACKSDHPHPDWDQLANLPYSQDIENLTHWVPAMAQRDPPSCKIAALWFVVCNPVQENHQVSADLYFFGSETFDAVGSQYRPSDARANSTILREIHRIAYGYVRVDAPPDNTLLGNDAEWALCLAFATFALPEILAHVSPTMFGVSGPIGVTVGFDGDFITLGALTTDGFQSASA